MERYCKYCGAQLPPSGNFCGKCGMPVGSGEDMFGSAEPTVDSYHYGDMNSGRGAAGGPVRPGQKKPGNGKTVLLAVAASLVLLVGVALAVKLILELRGEKDAVQEPAYTETIAEAAPQDTPEQPAPQDIAPEAPIQEAPAQEEPEEDAGAYQPDRILELQPGQLNWVVVTGDYDLYFSVPEGFVETPIGFSVNGNIYCYYAQTLDMLVRVWEAPVDMADDPGSSRLCTAYGFYVDEASMQETENSRRYTCTGSGRRMSVYETWGDLYAYYFMFEYPDSSMLHTSAYEDLASAFLSRASCNNVLTQPVSAYILPQSAERRLTEADLEGLSHQQLCLARNEIYARHGRRFKNKDIAAYFAEKDWYYPSIDASVFDANQNSYLSEDELYNATFMLGYEKRKFGKSYY